MRKLCREEIVFYKSGAVTMQQMFKIFNSVGEYNLIKSDYELTES